MENENRLVKINYQGKEITLIPTAHVSKESAQFTAQVIDEIKPDSICIELDQDRYNSMVEPEKYRQTDVIKIIKEKKTALFIVNLILASYQRRIATSLDSQNGSEMLVGINKAKELNAQLVLADRKVQTTFKRIWANQKFADKIKLVSLIISSIFDDEEISEEDLKNLQQSDMLASALSEVTKQFPRITEVLVDERDKYIAYKVKNAPGEKVVAILGAAHTINVPKYIEQDYSIEEFDKIPEKTLASKLSAWIIPAIIVILILSSFKIDSSLGFEQIKTWVLVNGTCSGIGALIGGGHILTILASFIAAPITSLNPLLASGFFAGIVEATVRKPTVKDFDDLANDTTSLKGFWKNKVTRILIIVLLASLGSSLGTFVSGFDIIKSIISKL